MACATAYDEDQVSDMDALTNDDGGGGVSNTVSNAASGTPVTVASNNDTATVQASSTSSTTSANSTSSTNTSGETSSTMATSNTSSTSSGGDGGSSTSSSTEDTTTLGTGGSGGGMTGAGGTTTMGAATTMGMGGTAPGTTECTDPQEPDSAGNSGNFGTTDAICYFVPGDQITQGWGCSNTEGRTVTVNGEPSQCGGMLAALPDQMDGGYYFAFSAGSNNFASFYWY